MIETGTKYSKRKVGEAERKKMREKRKEKYHRQLAQEQVKRSKIAQKQGEEDKNVPESEDEEESEEEGGKKAIAPGHGI